MSRSRVHGGHAVRLLTLVAALTLATLASAAPVPTSVGFPGSTSSPCPPEDLVSDDPTKPPSIPGDFWDDLPDYRKNYYRLYPSAVEVTCENGQWKAKALVTVHHTVEQQVLRRWPGLFTREELDDPEWLIGFELGVMNRWAHLSAIRKAWNAFYALYPKGVVPTKQAVLDWRDEINRRLKSAAWESNPQNNPDTDFWGSRPRSNGPRLSHAALLFGLGVRKARSQRPKGLEDALESASAVAEARIRCLGDVSRAGRRTATRGIGDCDSDGWGDTEELARGLSVPGGVDFSSLGLRYLALGEGETDGVDFAFHADRVRGRSRGDGLRSAEQASDAFFVWLALRPTAFVVNLKPDEPDRIIDREFGRTEAGRILLEADLRLKEEAAWAIHPRTDLGQRFWDAVGTRCVPGSRLWITPGVAKVREDGDSFYILDAPLQVNQQQWDYTPSPGDPAPPGPVTCAGQSAAEQRRISETYRRMVLPVLRRAVNNAPEFADLRRVYLSRVAAEWYRERSEDGATRFAGIIDSGRIGRWVSRDKWRPMDTFGRYLRSFTEGEYTHTSSDGSYRWSVTVGGVDFGHVPENPLGSRAFERGWPGLADQVRSAIDNGRTGSGDELWLGGRSPVDPEVLAQEFPVSPAPDTDQQGGPSTRQLVVTALILAGVALLAFGFLRSIRSRPISRQE